jgi:hypothetical protein
VPASTDKIPWSIVESHPEVCETNYYVAEGALAANPQVSKNIIMKYIAQVLADANIIHCDLKPEVSQ